MCLPSGSVSSLDKSAVFGRRKAAKSSATAVSTTVSVVEVLTEDIGFKTDVKQERNLCKRDGMDGLETDTVCALRLLMVCFEKQGIAPTSIDAYKLFRNFAEEYYNDD